MGICKDCGQPCHYCSPPDRVSILMIPESIRPDVEYMIESLHLTTKQRVDSFINEIQQYPEKKIAQAIRKWRNGGYSSTGKNDRYFFGILRRCCTEREPLLDDLPPKYRRESTDADGQA